MEPEATMSPLLLYLNMQSFNTRAPHYIAIAPPPPVKRADERGQPVVRIIPNYQAPSYSPILFCVGQTSLFQVSFSLHATVMSAAQSDLVVAYGLGSTAPAPFSLVGMGGACEAVLLVKQVLGQLTESSSATDLLMVLLALRPPTEEQLHRQCEARFDTLDQSWLWSLKWARASMHSLVAEMNVTERRQSQLAGARKLHGTVVDAYRAGLGRDDVQDEVERTTKNILEDYRYCQFISDTQ